MLDKEKFIKWLKEQIKSNDELAKENRRDTEVKRMFKNLSSAYDYTLSYVELGEFDIEPKRSVTIAGNAHNSVIITGKPK